jgi:plastocyanin
MHARASGRRTTRRAFLGATATAIGTAGVASTATAQESATTVEVGPGGDLVFEPGTDDPLYVKTGATVTFEWKSDGHNIVVGSQPDGASWEGTEGGASKLYNTGHTHEHTFETKGKYHYWCEPHKAAGMVADIVVNDTGEAPSSGSSGGQKGRNHAPVPPAAKSLAIGTLTTMFGVLGLGYFFVKFEGDYGVDEE